MGTFQIKTASQPRVMHGPCCLIADKPCAAPKLAEESVTAPAPATTTAAAPVVASQPDIAAEPTAELKTAHTVESSVTPAGTNEEPQAKEPNQDDHVTDAAPPVTVKPVNPAVEAALLAATTAAVSALPTSSSNISDGVTVAAEDSLSTDQQELKPAGVTPITEAAAHHSSAQNGSSPNVHKRAAESDAMSDLSVGDEVSPMSSGSEQRAALRPGGAGGRSGKGSKKSSSKKAAR